MARLFRLSIIFFSLITSVAISSAEPADVIADETVASKHGLSVSDVRRLRDYRGLSNSDLLEMSSSRVARTLWRLNNPRPDQPFAAAEYRQTQLTGGPDVRPPAGALARAISQLKELRSQISRERPQPQGARTFSAREVGAPADVVTVAGMPVGPLLSIAPAAAAPAVERSDASSDGARSGMLELNLEPLIPPSPSPAAQRSALAPPGGVSTLGWHWLGPGNIGGRTRSIVIHPSNSRIIWVGAVAGGVWKTVDGGQNWAPLADFMANLNVSALLLDPSNANVLYAGTGEGHYNLDAFRGAGIFRSLDAGATWTQLPATNRTEFHFVNRLALTADRSALLVATRSGMFRSTTFSNGNASAITFDAVADLAGRDLLYVGCHPTDRLKCVAGGRGRTAYFSTDGGIRWQRATGLPDGDQNESFAGRVELTYAAADGNIVYASVDRNKGEIYRSTDGGQNFSLRSSGSQYLSAQGWYDNAIWAGDPTRPDLVVVGGIDLYRSLDGGRTLTKISEWWRAPASAHADQHAIVSHPSYNGSTNRVVFFGNDGGIYRNDDVLTAAPSQGWVSLNNNYGVTQFYGAAGNMPSGRIVGGAQDNGTLLYTPPPGPVSGPNGYSAMFGGDGGFAAADPSNPNFMYGEYVFLQLHRSIDGGRSSAYIYAGIDDAGNRDTSLFIAPFILDVANPEVMLAGGQSLWRSRNVTAATPAWESIKEPVVASGNRPALISAIDGRPSDGSNQGSDVLWVGYSNGQVFRSDSGRSDFSDLEQGRSKRPTATGSLCHPGADGPSRHSNRLCRFCRLQQRKFVEDDGRGSDVAGQCREDFRTPQSTILLFTLEIPSYCTWPRSWEYLPAGMPEQPGGRPTKALPTSP